MDATATELARLVRDGALSAVEVVEAHLRRIEAVNPAINAVVALDAERALAAARELDASRGPDGPLRGVPFRVKDDLEAAGLSMTIGDPARAGARRLAAAVCHARGVKRIGIALVALAAVGAVVALVSGDSTAATAVAIVLIGSAAVGAVSLAFLAVGRAEDRDRAEAAARAAEREPGPEATNGSEEPHPRTLGLGPGRRRPRPPRRPQ
jgi:hypothetical protein